MDFSVYDQRPIVIAVAGSNGAGKSTFYHAHLAAAGMHFVNADVIAHELALAPYDAARAADALRRELLSQGEMTAAKQVIDAGDNALIYTDSELIFQINERLDHDARICKSTLEKWKAGAKIFTSFEPSASETGARMRQEDTSESPTGHGVVPDTRQSSANE